MQAHAFSWQYETILTLSGKTSNGRGKETNNLRHAMPCGTAYPPQHNYSIVAILLEDLKQIVARS